MAKKYAPRHRAARRPLTPLSGINTTENRRKAAAVAATGLGVAFVVTSNAIAAGESTKGADVAKLTSHAKSALKSNPEVSVAQDATWEGNATTTATVAVDQPRVAAAVARNAQTRDTAVTQRASAERASRSAAAVPAPSVSGGSIVDIAMRYTGVRYTFGGTTPSGFDCSGFTSYVYRQKGINLPHKASSQARMGHRVSRSQARPGDLIHWGGHHVGIYVGGNMMIDSAMPGTRIKVRKIWGNPGFRRL